MQGETAQISETGRIRPLAAYRAIRALFKNKEDTGQVFKIVAALQGNSMANCMARFRSSPVGRQVLAENRQLLATLCNREYLRSLPEDSFGRIYHRFLETEGLSAEGLVDASNESQHWEKRQAEFALFASRVRDSHDLNHVLTGYGRNPLGEICVLTFAYPHTRNRGIGVLILAGMFKFKKDLPREIPVFRAILEAYRNGKKAAWLPGVDSTARLPMPSPRARSFRRPVAGRNSRRPARSRRRSWAPRTRPTRCGRSGTRRWPRRRGDSASRAGICCTPGLTSSAALPGPHSANRFTPRAASALIVSAHRTACHSCCSKAVRIACASLCVRTSTLCSTGMMPAQSAVALKVPANARAASRISAQCDGTLTASGTTRRAPASRAIAQALSTAALSPAITICPGELKLAQETTWPSAAAAQTSVSAGSSRPIIAAIAPPPAGVAFCIR